MISNSADMPTNQCL